MSREITTDEQGDWLWKAEQARRFSNTDKAFYEEEPVSGRFGRLDLVNSPAQDPPSPAAGGDSVTEHVLLECSEVGGDGGSNQLGWDTGFENWVPPGWGGSDYGVKVYDDDDIEIDTTEPPSWFFDYNTGTIFFTTKPEDDGWKLPIKISGWRFSGKAAQEVVYMDEESGDPTTPQTGRWGAYFKSDGLYTLEDDGAVEGPLADSQITNRLGSAGWVSGGEVTDAGSETIDVAAGAGLFHASNDEEVKLHLLPWGASAGIAIPTDTVRHVGAINTAGTVAISVNADESTYNGVNGFTLATVINQGGVIYVDNHKQRALNYAFHSQHRVEEVDHVRRADKLGGLILEDLGSQKLKVSAGELYITEEYVIGEIDTSAAGEFILAYVTSGTWTLLGAQDTWPDTQYNDTTTGLEDLSNPIKWTNLWFYLRLDGILVLLYGQAEFNTEALAAEDAPPASLPLLLSEHSKLIGRFVFQNNAGAATALSAFSETFTAAVVTDHGNLAGLSDDDHDVVYVNRTETIESASDPTAFTFQRSLVGPAVITEDDVICKFQFEGYDDAAYTECASIVVAADENWGAGDHGTRMSFFMTGVNDSDDPAEVLRLAAVDAGVNYLKISNAANTDVDPLGRIQIAVDGASSNMSMVLRSKGTGQISLDNEVFVESNKMIFFVNGTQDPSLEFSTALTLDVAIAGSIEMSVTQNQLVFNNGATDTGFNWTANARLGFDIGGSEEMNLRSKRLTFDAGTTDPALEWPSNGALGVRIGFTTEAVFSANGLDIVNRLNCQHLEITGARSSSSTSTFVLDDSIDAPDSQAADPIPALPTDATGAVAGWKRCFLASDNSKGWMLVWN